MNMMVGRRGASRRRVQRVAVEFTAWLSLGPDEPSATISTEEADAAETGAANQSAPR